VKLEPSDPLLLAEAARSKAMARKNVVRFPRPTPTLRAGRYFTVIPAFERLTPEEREVVESGGAYPVRVVNHLPQHRDFVDYLIERSFEAWTRSPG
jgi:hypothetical protein